jgi:hypothetical protein
VNGSRFWNGFILGKEVGVRVFCGKPNCGFFRLGFLYAV